MNSHGVPTSPDDNHVSVIGAGVVGVSSALFLRLAGVPVTLYDPNSPGSGCSSGNAGMLGVDSCVPVALPGVGLKIPGMLASSDGPLGLDPLQVFSSLPWFLQFLKASAPDRVSEISTALNRLQVHLLGCYDTVLSAAGAHHLIEKAGKIHLYEKEQTFEAGKLSRQLQSDHGVEFALLAPEEVAQMSPGLLRDVYRGVFYPNACHCINPQRMVESLAEAFVERGGAIVRDKISDIEIGATGPKRIVGEIASYPVRRIVLAAGIGSKNLARRLGAKVPMISHRGYHVMLPRVDLRLPVKSEDRKVILTPMAEGIRITGIAEISRPDKAAVPRFWDQLKRHAQDLMPDPIEYSDPNVWMGSRPCTPDSLPVIGRSPRFPSVVLAYGHGHFGLGLGPVTGRLVCDILTGAQPLVPLEAYRPDRFAA
jgi:D-amino-acid dehydrogenase